MSFGSRFKTARERIGLSQQGLADMLNVTDGTISNYEKGVAYPRWDTINKICDILKVDPNYLFWDDMSEILRAKVEDESNTAEIKVKSLEEKYLRLNELGQNKVSEYIEDLSQIQKYTKNLVSEPNYRLVANEKQSGDAIIRRKPKIT